MGTKLNIRIEVDASFPNDIWVHDQIYACKHSKLVKPNELKEYIGSLLKMAELAAEEQAYWKERSRRAAFKACTKMTGITG